MLKADIFLEKTVNYTIRSKFIMKIVLIIEYLAIFIESMNSIRYLYRDPEPTTSANALYIVNQFNPFYYIIKIVNCQNPNISKTPSCNIPDNLIFYLCFVIYFILYFLYSHKYENSIKETIKIEDRENHDNDKNILKGSFSQTLLINYFNIVLRLVSIFLFYLNISTLISSVLWMSNNSSFFSLQLIQFIMAASLMSFSIVFQYNLIRCSTLMFRYNDVNSHFECFFSKKYDIYLLILKILIPLRTAMEYFDINIGNMNSYYNFSKVYLNLVLLILLVAFVFFILSELFNDKIICVSCFTLNYYRLFFLIYNFIFLIFFYFFYESHKLIFLMVTSLICSFIIAVFTTILLFERNILNLMNDSKIIYMAVYMYQKQTKTLHSDKGNQVGVEFSVRHKLTCQYTQWKYHQSHAFSLSKELKYTGEEEVQKCHICVSDDSYGVQLESLMAQMKANKKSGKVRWTTDEEHYYKMLKLILKSDETDIIGLVYKTNKILHKSKGYYFSFVKLYYNFISSRGDNQDAIKRYTDIKTIYDTSKLIHTTIKDLLDVYDRVKSADCDIHSLAERLSTNKQDIYKNIEFLLTKTNHTDNYSIILLKFIFENLFNDESLFKGEKPFYDFEDFLSTVYQGNNNIQLSYNYPQNSLRVIRASHLYIDYLDYKFEDLFPEHIKYEQLENFTNIIKKITSNNFEVECMINSLPDKQYVCKMKLSCVISYSLEMSEFFIQAKYQILDEDILITHENRSQLFIVNTSKNVGHFLSLSSNLIAKLQQFGLKIDFSSIFKKTIIEELYSFNYIDYYNYFNEIYDEFTKQSNDDELTAIIENLKAYVSTTKQLDYNFKLIHKGSYKNYLIYSVIQPDIVKAKERAESKETALFIENHHGNNEESQGPSTGSNVSISNKRMNTYEMGNLFKFSDKSVEQEHVNTNKLLFLSRLLSWFSIVVILYCCFFMYTGIADNVKMNESFLIKNKFDFIERLLYQTTASIINGFSIIDPNVNFTFSNSSITHFDYLNKNKDITINIINFVRDESEVKTDLFGSGILELELLIESSFYHVQYNDFITKTITYSAMTNIAGNLGINYMPYQLFDVLKIYMNNIKVIGLNSYVRNYIYMFSYINGQPDLSRIINTNLTSSQVKVYELILNFEIILKQLLVVRELVFTFHDEVLNDIFSRSFYMTYILMAINFVLIFISVFLISHLKNIMIYNSMIINELTTKDSNIKLMRNKLVVLKNMNKFYMADPNELAKKLNKISIEVMLGRKLIEEKRNVGKHNEEPKKIEKIKVDNLNSMDQMRHLRPLINIIIILLIVYYSHSTLFSVLLKSACKDVSFSTSYFKLSTEKFKGVTNSLNLIQLIILTNTTDQELYTRLIGSEPDTGGFLTHLHEEIFNDWILIQNYEKWYSLFDPLKVFLTSTINCNYLYTSTNISIYNTLAQQYSNKNLNINIPTSLTTICEIYNYISKDDTNLIEENLIYSIKGLMYQYLEANTFIKLKTLYDSPPFDDLFLICGFILSPLNTYFNTSLVNVIEKKCFDTYLMYSIIYLCLNIVLDISIVIIYQIKIIQKIRKINQDLTNLLEIFKIY